VVYVKFIYESYVSATNLLFAFVDGIMLCVALTPCGNNNSEIRFV